MTVPTRDQVQTYISDYISGGGDPLLLGQIVQVWLAGQGCNEQVQNIILDDLNSYSN